MIQKYEVRTELRPKALSGISDEQIDQHWTLYEGYVKNVNLLKQFVTDQGRILPRKYTGLPAHYQRQLNRSVKRARQMLLMK